MAQKYNPTPSISIPLTRLGEGHNMISFHIFRILFVTTDKAQSCKNTKTLEQAGVNLTYRPLGLVTQEKEQIWIN